jgi:membrane protease YdiL (CAAX protease family)
MTVVSRAGDLRPWTWTQIGLLFGIPTGLNLIVFGLLIPWLDRQSRLPIEAIYFLGMGGLVLAPMFLAALVLAGREIGSYRFADLMARFRVRRLSRLDWLWTVAGFVGLSVASLLIADQLLPLIGAEAKPWFFRDMPLEQGRFWLVAVWPLFFFFNIFGEEFYWRGLVLPRQELLSGRAAWLVHGLLWAVWHLPLGLILVLTSTPILFILPAIVQFRRNTSIAIVIHGIFGAMGFLVLAYGLVD